MPSHTSTNGQKRRSLLRNVTLGGGAIIALALLFSTIMQPPVPTALIGAPAPDITLPLLDGGTFSIANHAGEVIVLDFWATWCPPCRVSMPIADRVVEEFADRGVHLYFVNEGESPEMVEEFLDESGLRAPIALDINHTLGVAYQAQGLPFTVIVGRDGTVKSIRVGAGMNYEHELRHDLETALAE